MNQKDKNLVYLNSPDSVIAEQFRTIRSNIEILTYDYIGKVILFTSSNEGEGTSTLLANLGISLSQNKNKVLIIDANLRNPKVHSIYKLSNTNGLSKILSNHLNIEKNVHYSGINGLDIIPSGEIANNPSELLASVEMKELLKVARTLYDIVLVDTAPILESAETRILAGECDGVILVVNKGKTQMEKAIESKRVLEFVKANLIGVVLNENK